MKKLNLLSAICVSLCFIVLTGCQTKSDCNYTIEDGVIVVNEPAREAGQQSVLGFSVAPIDTVRVGIIGLGMRGQGAVERYTHIDGAKIVAICDLYQNSIDKTQERLREKGMPEATPYIGEESWKELCSRNDIDLVYIVTPWQSHTPMAVYAMEQGKHVAIEVPAATNIEECWALVNTAEKTQRHCMMLENCVYDFFELTSLNMAQQGLFGEVLHAEGAYIHNLEPYWEQYQDNWRLDFNQKNRGDVYPTHGMGPVCQALNIHRGDKMNYLVSVDTKSVNGLEIAKNKMGVESFANGDQTTTVIKTENGKTMLIEHNVYTPRPYSRMYQLTGTKGFASKYPFEGYAIRGSNIKADSSKLDYQSLDGESYMSDQMKQELMLRYKHPIVVDIEQKAKTVGGHGGMDFIMDYRLIYCLQRGLPLDMDVYDAAEWSCLGELTALSLENGSKPVRVPDFTRGEWKKLESVTFAQ